MNRIWNLFPAARNLSTYGKTLLCNNVENQIQQTTRSLSVLTTKLEPLFGQSNSKIATRILDNNTCAVAVLVPTRGMKVKAAVKKRCKDCYLTWTKGILHNLCRTHGRHSQRLKPKYWVNLRILTAASTAIKKPW